MSLYGDALPSRWQPPLRISTEVGWYDLFSRGARDWLRHNEKVRESVEKSLPNLIAGPDVLSGPGGGTVLVPVRLAEHARFRLRDAESETGAGQGAGEPGQVLKPGQPQQGDQSGSEAGSGQGDLQFVLELKVEDVLDWLWEELKLPDLKPKQTARQDEADYVRETLVATKGNKSEAAKILGISRKNLYERLARDGEGEGESV